MRPATLAMALAAASQACTTRDSCASLVDSVASALPASIARGVRVFGSALLDARTPAAWAHGLSSVDSTYCPNSGPFDLVPITVANLSQGTTSTSWGGDGCFAQMTATATWAPGAGGVSVKLEGATPSGPLCSDVYVLATSFSLAFPVEVSALAPTATISLPAWPGADEALDITLNGISIGLLPCGIAGSLVSLVNTVNIFSPLSGDVTDLIKSNSEFLNGRKVWNGPEGPGSPLVPFGKLTAIAPSAIRSGDYLSILRFDGLDPMIGFGTGSGGTGHSAVALWKGSDLFVVEATDRDPFGPAVYFGSGIIVTPWARWVALAQNATYNVAILPLAPALASAFDVDAAWAWFAGVEGASYGYS